jgi:pyridoxine 5-phosphate synthase
MRPYRSVLLWSEAASYGDSLGLVSNAGHGLHYQNVAAIARIPEIVELNIGHSIIARAVFDGLSMAVAEMKRLMLEARNG